MRGEGKNNAEKTDIGIESTDVRITELNANISDRVHHHSAQKWGWRRRRRHS